MHTLTVTDTQTGATEELYSGSYMDCIGEFQRRSSWSFANHKRYSTLHYEISQS
jgi:hypothetical protein